MGGAAPVTETSSAAPVAPVAVLGVGAAAPTLRLAAAEAGAAWGSGGGSGTLAVCDADEDALTLAWQAATAALDAAGVEGTSVTGLWWGTSRPPMAEGPSHVFLCSALGHGAGASGCITSGSPHAGMDALVAAWDAVVARPGTVALVVASDALVPGPGTAAETAMGAGAAAVVLASVAAGDSAPGSNGSSPGARLVARATRALPALDRYRADGAALTEDVYDARLFREEVFVPLLAEAGAAVAGGGAPVAAWSLSDPDGKLAGAVGTRLGAPVASAPVWRALGDTGAAAPLLGLVHACAGGGGAGTTGRLGMVGYGGGRATAVVLEVQRPVPGATGVEDLGPSRRTTYIEALRARGTLVAAGESIQMGVPPGGAAFVRGNPEMLGLTGARCAECGTISTPPSIHPACVGCGGNALSEVRLSRRGTVQTFVVNQTMPPPFQAPLPLLVLDLDDGARIMVQGSPADAADLAIGDTVTLSLRRYALERGVPVYGYKTARAAGGGAPSAPASAGSTKEGGT